MSRTRTVKDLIKELLEFDMDEPVYVALGSSYLCPSGSSEVSHVSMHDSGVTCGYGVYIHPVGKLLDSDA